MPGNREEDFQRKNTLTPSDLYDHALTQDPCPWGDEIYNLGKSWSLLLYT